MSDGKYMSIFVSIMIIVITFLMMSIEEPNLQFWRTEDQRNIQYCLTHKPQPNISDSPTMQEFNFFDDRIELCYTKYWHIYCQYSYPKDCPK